MTTVCRWNNKVESLCEVISTLWFLQPVHAWTSSKTFEVVTRLIYTHKEFVLQRSLLLPSNVPDRIVRDHIAIVQDK